MKQFDATYSVSDRPIEDFYMEEPKLPECRRKTSGWTFTLTSIYTLDDSNKTHHISRTIERLIDQGGSS